MRLQNLALLLTLSLAALACSGQKKTGSISVSAASAGAPSTSGASIDVGGGIKVDAVRVLVKEIELEGDVCVGPGPSPSPSPSPGPSPSPSPAPRALASVLPHGGDDGDDDADECEVEMGPIAVDLRGADLSGKVTKVFDAELPVGTYRELKIKICGSNSGPGSGNGASVVIDGSITPSGSTTAKPFTLSLALCAEIKKETRIEVGSGTSNVTLTIDPAQWFAGPNGTTLDPTVDANAAAISANVAASIGAFRDDDHDGHDDDGPGHH